MALIVKKALLPEKVDIENPSDFDAIWSQIRVGQKRILVGSIYISPSASNEAFENLLKHLKSAVSFKEANKFNSILAEADNENLQSKTLEVFEELDEKPFFKAERLGRKMEDSKSRPVKVTMDNPVVVSELLKKSRDLKNSTDHNAVYLKPDRTVEQRRKHRELVNELKQSIKDSPDKRHFIRNGEICHEENVKMDKADVPAKSVSSGPGVTKKKEKTRKILLPHHIVANRRPPRGYVSPVTTDCD